jgi:Ti-type conjugative transfer relaxase TraA
MAIYHFTSKIIARGGGKSSVASAAYRAGEKLYDERQEKVMDYTRKQDVMFKEIFLPEGAPKWMAEREKLWNVVERVERRKDAQLAREIHFSLPRELSKEQNIELAKEFVKNEFVARGMIADLCIHDGMAKDGEQQPHAHVMLTMREVAEEGFGLKERSWNDKDGYMLWRESWAEHANKYLAMNGIEQRIDHRSYVEQGIDLIPQNKIGPVNLREHERKLAEHQEIARKNGEKILEDPTIALKAITYHQSTFTHQDLARFINRNSVDAEQFQMVYEKVRNSGEIVSLGKDSGIERFTTAEMVRIETRMIEDAVSLRGRANIAFKEPRSLDKSMGGISLSEEQKNALNHIIGDGDIKCLVGYAGTGKSLLLNQAREIWEEQGYRVHGATLSGIAAENLEGASGIESRTLASRFCYWDMGRELLTNKDVLVIDEAGMLGSKQLARAIEETKKYGAKVIPIGDPQQLQSIEAGGAFLAVVERIGFLELTEVRRQQELWQKEATKEFALRHTAEAIGLYEQYGFVHYSKTQEEAKEALIEKWNSTRLAEPEKTQIMLAYTQRDAEELNRMARECRQENNELSEEHELQTAKGNKNFAVGDKVYFLRNDKNLGVKNGTLGMIENIDKRNGMGQVTVRVEQESGENKTVTFELDRYNYITHGYAATIHKAQGVTVDYSHILASKHLDSHAIYVAMSRHKEWVHLYWSKEEFENKKELEQILGMDRSKDVTLDYMGKDYREYNWQKEIREGTEQEKSVAELVKEIVSLDKESGEQYVGELEVNQQSEPTIEKKEQTDSDILNTFREQFEREHPELAAQAHEEIATVKEMQEYREKRYEEDAKIHAEFLKEQERIKNAEITKQEIEFISPEKRRVEDLIEKYYKLEGLVCNMEELNKYGLSLSEATDRMEKCAHEICNNDYAMDYLKKNDKDLFEEMDHRYTRESEIDEPEKTMGNREKELDFDLSL